jgi:thiamine pyrophosphate-dependent acetolactate synthase large subunit-like protein
VNVAEAVGRLLTRSGVDTVFGVVGSGNFHVTNALVADGARFIAARHEGGAATMADAYARLHGGVGVLSVHQGPGLTNALTGITEAAKSRTPLLILAAEATSERSNFWIDQSALAEAVGAVSARVHSAETVVHDVTQAFLDASVGRRTVLLSLPLDVQAEEVAGGPLPLPHPPGEPAVRPGAAPATSDDLGIRPDDHALEELAALLASARSPVFIAGRGAKLSGAREPLLRLAEKCGALLATSAVARGLFLGDPFDLDVSGGFASPVAVELIQGADLIVGWGCALNMWTLRQGALVGEDTTVVQVDLDAEALGAHQPVHLGVVGDVAATARAVEAFLPEARPGCRSPALADRLRHEVRWRDVPFKDGSDSSHIDPRTLSITLDDLLPRERTVAVDSGNFMGYPAMFLDVPDADGLVFTQAFQSIGLGLATAIGAAIARPDRLTVAALGDGGGLMGIAELETAVRLKLGLVIVVYNDSAYGAEVHHFGPGGHPLGVVTFPETDIAAVGRGFGCDGITVRRRDDLAGLSSWLAGPRDRPIVVDAKVTRDKPSWWLEEAFRGH